MFATASQRDYAGFRCFTVYLSWYAFGTSPFSQLYAQPIGLVVLLVVVGLRALDQLLSRLNLGARAHIMLS